MENRGRGLGVGFGGRSCALDVQVPRFSHTHGGWGRRWEELNQFCDFAGSLWCNTLMTETFSGTKH